MTHEEWAALPAPVVCTLWHPASAADLCRANGWTVGDRIAGEECGRWDVLTITAVGRRVILACNKGAASESVWDLSCRDWRRIGGAR